MTRTAAAALPAASGKTAGSENFPVASVLLPTAVRRQVMAFYAFARVADDVADSPDLTPDAKLARLDGLESALRGEASATGSETAADFRRAVDADEVLVDHAAQLLQAFRRDALIDHCRDWADLLTYCQFSAAPVGRFLLDLHDESPETLSAGDALCAAHQILNHLQDCGKDFKALGRIYIPRDWLLAAGVSNDVFAGDHSPAELRAVYDMVLDRVDGLIDVASPLPSLIRDRRLRLEAAATLAVAERLSALLRTHDPLAAPVRLSPWQYLVAFLTGIARGLRAA